MIIFAHSRKIWMVIFLLVHFVLGANTVLAERDVNIDSLLRIKCHSEKQKSEWFVELSLAYASDDYFTSYSYVDSAYSLALKNNDAIVLVKAGRLKAQLLRKLDRVDESLQILQQIMPIAKVHGLRSEYKRALNTQALGYLNKGEFEDALKCNLECLMLREEDRDTAEISVTLHNLGLVYYKLRNLERALYYYQKSLALKIGANKIDLDRLLINIALCYSDFNNYDLALKYVNMAFSACGNNCTMEIQAEGKFAMGVSILASGNLNGAESFFLESYRLAEELGNKKCQIENLLCLAKIHNRRQDYNAGTRALESAEALSLETEYEQIKLDIYNEFISLFRNQNDISGQSLYQAKYIQLNERLQDGQLAGITKIQTEYQEKEFRQAILAQRQIVKLKEDSISNHRLMMLFIGVIALLLIGLAISLYRSKVRKHRINLILDNKVKERTLSLQNSLGRLRKTNEMQIQFLNKTSQDIRDPVLRIKGLCNLILTDKKKSGLITEEIQRLEQTTTDLLDIVDRIDLEKSRTSENRFS